MRYRQFCKIKFNGINLVGKPRFIFGIKRILRIS